MQTQINNLLDAAKLAMTVLTAEDEDYWRKSQKYEEAPYYFLYKAIVETENCVEISSKLPNL